MLTSFLSQDQDGQELYSTISLFSQINDTTLDLKGSILN